MIDLQERDLATICRILAKHVPGCEVRAFGSRVAGGAKPSSDIDMVIIGREKLPRDTMSRLRYAFEESDLAFRVDLLDWQTISTDFKSLIEKKFEVIQRPSLKSDCE